VEQSRSAVDARQTEIAAFTRVNRELAAAKTPAQRIRATGNNHELWSLLLQDLGKSGNRLAQPLKGQLINLAIWSMSYSIRANLRGLPIEPLINVNTSILEGLKAQVTNEAAAAAPKELSRSLAV
jgi:flagellar protein FlaF